MFLHLIWPTIDSANDITINQHRCCFDPCMVYEKLLYHLADKQAPEQALKFQPLTTSL